MNQNESREMLISWIAAEEHEIDQTGAMDRRPSERTFGAQWSPTLLDQAWMVMDKARRSAARSLLPTAITPGSISGLDPTTLDLWVDLSHWNGDVDMGQMAPYIGGAFVKASDGKQIYPGSDADLSNYRDKTFRPNVQKLYEAGRACVPYHYWQWNYPGFNLDHIIKLNYERFMAAIDGLAPGKSYQALAIDVEEKGDTGVNARDKVMGMANLIWTDSKLTEIPLVFYTSMGVLGVYPALSDWLSFKGANRNLWLAQWIFTQRTTVTWPELKNTWLPKINMKVQTPGYADWKWAQLAACFMLPGGTAIPTDINLFKGSQAQCWSWLKFQGKPGGPPENPPPQPPPGDIEKRLLAVETEQAAQAGLIAQHETRLNGIAAGAAKK